MRSPSANLEHLKPLKGIDVVGVQELGEIWDVVSAPVT